MITKTLPKAWKAFRKNKKYLLLIILLEFFFIAAAAHVHLSFFAPSAEAADRAGDIMLQEVEKLPDTELFKLETLLKENQEFMSAYHDLLAYIGFFLVSMFAVWIIFKTPVWHLAHKTIYKKMPMVTSFLKFPLLSLFWFLLLLLIFSMYSFATGSTSTILPFMVPSAVTFLMYGVFILFFYFSQVSFALIPAQQTFKSTFVHGIKYWKTLVPVFLVNALITFVVITLPFNWIRQNPLLGLAIILFITLPALAFARVHMIVGAWQHKKHG